MQERYLAANEEHISWSAEQSKRIEAVLDRISMDFTGRPFDEIPLRQGQSSSLQHFGLALAAKSASKMGEPREREK